MRMAIQTKKRKWHGHHKQQKIDNINKETRSDIFLLSFVFFFEQHKWLCNGSFSHFQVTNYPHKHMLSSDLTTNRSYRAMKKKKRKKTNKQI
jgi:hypothetical protein